MNGNVVKVVLWGKTVGHLSWDKSNWRTETSVFQFDRDFLTLGWDISPIELSISSKIVRSGISIRGGNPKDVFGGLHPVFADSLPDHWGNSLFRAWAKEHKVSTKDVSSVDYLSFIGKRGMGALEYLPAAIEDEDVPFDVDVTRLYEFAKSVLDERTKTGGAISISACYFGPYGLNGSYASHPSGGKVFLKEKKDKNLVLRFKDIRFILDEGEYQLNRDLTFTSVNTN